MTPGEATGSQQARARRARIALNGTHSNSYVQMLRSGLFSPTTPGKKDCRFAPSKPALRQAALLEPPAGAARAEIVPAELLFQQLVAMHDPLAPLDLGLRREAPAALAHRFEKNGSSWGKSWSMIRLLGRRG